ncbi:MAG: hypothetical protein ACM32E_24045 [Gemmatimonadota bacterium]
MCDLFPGTRIFRQHQPAGRASLEGDLASQIEHAEREAGVRRQL